MVIYSAPVVQPLTHTILPGLNPAIITTTDGFFPVCSVQTSSFYPVVTFPVMKQNCVTEVVWNQIFQKLFSTFLPHKWYLMPVTSKPEGTWHTLVDSAKVRFCCEACGHGWTSMKGRVTFWCSLLNNQGSVAFRLYGQQCVKCQDGGYESALWYSEEIIRVLTNTCHKVAHVYYGFAKPSVHLNRRPGRPRTPHDSERCQACRDAVCTKRR